MQNSDDSFLKLISSKDFKALMLSYETQLRLIVKPFIEGHIIKNKNKFPHLNSSLNEAIIELSNTYLLEFYQVFANLILKENLDMSKIKAQSINDIIHVTSLENYKVFTFEVGAILYEESFVSLESVYLNKK